MKRLRPRCFEEILIQESSTSFYNIDLIRVERLRRLVWCYNKYIRHFTPSVWSGVSIILAEYYGRVRRNCPSNIWLPKLK